MSKILKSIEFNPILTSLATGYTNNLFVADKLFPVVNVDKKTGQIPTFGKEAFRLRNALRRNKAASNVMLTEGADKVQFDCQEYDLMYPIDQQDIEDSDWLNLASYGTNLTTEGIRLMLEHQAATIATTAANYASGNKTVLTSGAGWNESGGEPINNMDTAFSGLRSAIGKSPNTVVFGQGAWAQWKKSAKVKAAISANLNKVVTLQLTKELLEIENVFIGDALYTADGSDVLTPVWGNNVVCAYVTETPSEQRNVYEPTFGWTLRMNGYPYTDIEDEGKKVEYVRTTDRVSIKVVGATAGYLISNVVI